MKHYDLIIVGAGPVGLATAYHSAKKGLRVLVIEQYQINNQLSSSSGSTRQFRLQYSEEYMSKLCLESISYWDEIQSETSKTLRSKVGSLWFGVSESDSTEGEISDAMRTMNKLNIPYEKLDSNLIENSFHFKNLPVNYVGFFQKDGGTINVNETINVLKALCDRIGNVNFEFENEVKYINTKGVIEVTTNNNTFSSHKLLISAGPFANRLLNSTSKLNFNIWQMVSLYFKITDLKRDLPSWFAFEEESEDDPGFYYGFEHCTWDRKGYLRIAPAYASDTFTDPSERKPIPNKNDVQRTINWVKKRLSFVDSNPEFITTCLASIPFGNQKMYLDFLREDDRINKNVVIFSSGWSFKFVPLLGKICTDLIQNGATSYDISNFGILDKKQFTISENISKRRLPF